MKTHLRNSDLRSNLLELSPNGMGSNMYPKTICEYKIVFAIPTCPCFQFPFDLFDFNLPQCFNDILRSSEGSSLFVFQRSKDVFSSLFSRSL